MFDNLQEKISSSVQKLRGQGKITEKNIQSTLDEVRKSLLEADVQYKVVQSFIDSVREQALGQDVLTGIEPGQQMVRIFSQELTRILGGKSPEIPSPAKGPLKILLVGLQGTGKTTSAAKLALYCRDEKKKIPLLVPADVSRPGAKEQLYTLAKENGLGAFEHQMDDAVSICKTAISKQQGRELVGDVMIFDSAGRLAIDESLMDELARVRKVIQPDLVLYVLDAMAGQDAVRTAKIFEEEIGFDGVILTKMDGDARGGSALSVHMVTGKPIFFLGVSEKVQGLELVHPDRLASRILGFGDIVSLVEKAQKAFDEKQSAKLAQKLRKNQFTIEDFAQQLQSMEKMGSMSDILGMMPGGAKLKKALPSALPEKEIQKTKVIISSMTLAERRNHQLINGSRRLRIAKGSGTSVQDVNRFLKQFLQAKNMMARISKMGVKGMRRGGLF
ncbi:MAG: signal recognition particle protein [Bdellovibrionales bacterium]|nr:signal recognition particle protein [Bdellovibrionales bacterium]